MVKATIYIKMEIDIKDNFYKAKKMQYIIINFNL